MINSKTCHDNLQLIGSQRIPTDMMHACPRNLPIFCVNFKKSIDRGMTKPSAWVFMMLTHTALEAKKVAQKNCPRFCYNLSDK